MTRGLLPNLLSVLRLALAPVITYDVLGGRFSRALALFIFAGITDAADGYLARRLRAESRLGAYLDPIADKLLLTLVYLALAAVGAFPWWLIGIVVARDVMILAGALVVLARTGERNFPPSMAGKLSTVIQIGAATAALAGVRGPAITWPVAAMTLISAAGYMRRGISLMARSTRSR